MSALEDFSCGQQISHLLNFPRPFDVLDKACDAAWLSGRYGTYARNGSARFQRDTTAGAARWPGPMAAHQ